MEKELDKEIIKTTQTTLGKYVKRPPLSEKLLKKPPFRFLHDIVTTVIKTTGFFEGLFENEELQSDNVKDREAKILFLHKVITVLNSATGKILSAKPSKIVAGQEPEKTNEILQCLAYALENNISSTEAVNKYKDETHKSKEENKGQTKSNKNENEVKKKKDNDKKLASKSNEKLVNQKKDVSNTSSKTELKSSSKPTDKSEKKRSNTKSKESPPKHTVKNSQVEKTSTNVKSDTKSDSKVKAETNTVIKENDHTSSKTEIILDKNDKSKVDKNNSENKSVTKLENGEPVKEKPPTEHDVNVNDKSAVSLDGIENNDNCNNSTNKNIEPRDDNDKIITQNDINEHIEEKTVTEQNQETLLNQVNNKLIRDNSIAENSLTESETKTVPNKTTLRPPSVRPSSSRPGAPRLREKHEEILPASNSVLMGKVNIIVENTPTDEDDESSLVVLDSGIDVDSVKNDLESGGDISSVQHGHLVQQILDSQKGLSQNSGKTEIEWEFGIQKTQEASSQEIEQMKFNIQAVSRAANPLGKLLDHIQEDVEVMRQELKQWTKIYEESSVELAKLKIANEDSLLPLHTKKKQLEADIEEKQEKINDMKIIIHKNSSRISKLLANGYVQ